MNHKIEDETIAKETYIDLELYHSNNGSSLGKHPLEYWEVSLQLILFIH